MTTTTELKNKLRFLKSFKGVFPCDRIPNIESFPASMILNTDKHNEKGEHWVAIHINKDKFGIYFDSYGLKPINKEFLEYLNERTDNWTYNHTRIQGMNSKNCGMFCVLFILLKSIGYSLHEIIHLFTKNYEINDKIIEKIYNNL